jgi:hypothetical protein
MGKPWAASTPGLEMRARTCCVVLNFLCAAEEEDVEVRAKRAFHQRRLANLRDQIWFCKLDAPSVLAFANETPCAQQDSSGKLTAARRSKNEAKSSGAGGVESAASELIERFGSVDESFLSSSRFVLG